MVKGLWFCRWSFRDPQFRGWKLRRVGERACGHAGKPMNMIPVKHHAKPADRDVTGRVPTGAPGAETGRHEKHLPSVTASVAKVRKRSHQSSPYRLASTKKLFLYLRGRIHARTASL